MKFTEKVRSTAESYVKQLQAAEKAIADHHKNGITEYSYERYKEIAAELEEKRRLIQSAGVSAVQAIIDEFKAELSRRYVAKGDEIDTGDMALLNSNYQLKAADLEAMFDRHPGNHTMLRAIMEYCETHDIYIMEYCETHDIYIQRVYYGEKAKAAAADSLRSYALSCFQRPDFGMETEAYFAQIFPEALAGD